MISNVLINVNELNFIINCYQFIYFHRKFFGLIWLTVWIFSPEYLISVCSRHQLVSERTVGIPSEDKSVIWTLVIVNYCLLSEDTDHDISAPWLQYQCCISAIRWKMRIKLHLFTHPWLLHLLPQFLHITPLLALWENL